MINPCYIKRSIVQLLFSGSCSLNPELDMTWLYFMSPMKDRAEHQHFHFNTSTVNMNLFEKLHEIYFWLWNTVFRQIITFTEQKQNFLLKLRNVLEQQLKSCFTSCLKHSNVLKIDLWIECIIIRYSKLKGNQQTG